MGGAVLSTGIVFKQGFISLRQLRYCHFERSEKSLRCHLQAAAVGSKLPPY